VDVPVSCSFSSASTLEVRLWSVSSSNTTTFVDVDEVLELERSVVDLGEAIGGRELR
jgi:hypothetical protein